MNNIVLDASAVLAILNKENGSETAEHYITSGVISTVNFSEVISVLENIGFPHSEATELTDGMLLDIIPFSRDHAAIAAELRKKTKSFGLSLGDRACLALAKSKKLPVLTADSIWSKLDIGITIKQIR